MFKTRLILVNLSDHWRIYEIQTDGQLSVHKNAALHTSFYSAVACGESQSYSQLEEALGEHKSIYAKAGSCSVLILLVRGKWTQP